MKFLSRVPHQKQKHKKLKLRTIISLGMIVVLIPIILFTLFRPTTPNAAWMDDAWLYRTSLTFTHNADVTNTKVKFDIATDALITAGKMQSDCGDSRFTDASGKVLEYYIDAAGGACNTNSTDYYVLIPTIVNGSNVIYHYYGNPTVTNGTNSVQFDQATTTPSGGAASTGTEEKSAGPVIFYKMDEGIDNSCSGSTNDVCDARGTTTDGAISNGTAWKNEDLCLSGKCLYFDGTDDVVTTTQTSAINLSAGLAAGFTFEAWIKPNSAGEGTGGQVFYKGATTWLRVDTLSGGKLDIEASLDLATTDATVNVASVTSDNQWVHVALSYTDDGDDEITIWINGKAVGTSTDGVGAPATDTNNLLLGGTTTNNFKGFIDEVKVYNFEKSAAQMASDAVIGASSKGNAAVMGQSSNPALNNGIVGYWNLDEFATPAVDESGNGNSGTWTGGAAAVGGKFGNGITLDGTGDYISVADSTSLSPTASVTISAWVKPNSSIATKAIIVKDGSYRLVTDGSGNPICQINNGSWQTAATSSTALTLSVWQHVTCTYDGKTQIIYVNGIQTGTSAVVTTIADSANTLRIGNDSGATYGDFNGVEDNARIFNRSLTSADVRSLYSWAAGSYGYWKLDDQVSTTTPDASGNGNTGTITGGVFSPGKYGNAFEADNVGNDYITVADTDTFDVSATGSFTISAWVKVKGDIAFGNPQAVISHGNGDQGSQTGYSLLVQGVNPGCAQAANFGNSVCLRVADGTDQYALTTNIALAEDGKYYYISAVFDRSSETNTMLYIDGVAQPVTRVGTFANIGAMSNTNPFCIAQVASGVNCQGGSMNLGVDDVKFYTYARTPAQIREDMNVNRPTGGSLNSPVAYWKFDDMNGTTAQDSGINNQDLTLTAAPAWTANGKINSDLDFESTSSQYASVTDTAALSITRDLSVSAWIKPESTTAATLFPIAGKGGGAVTSYFLMQYGDEIRMYIGSSSNYATTDSANLVAGTWYHVLGVYNALSQTVTLYINGKAETSTVTGTIPASVADGADSFVVGGFTSTTEVSFQIAATTEDGVEGNNTSWDDTPSPPANGMGYYTGLGDIETGVRFNNVIIPQGATISAAHLEVYASNANSIGDPGAVHIKIRADNVDDAAAWGAASRPSQITPTTAAIDWDPTSWTDAIWETSPSITSVIQEIVSRGGWASGNDLRIGLWNDGVVSGTNVVSFADYDSNAAISPILFVSYTSGSSSYYDGHVDDVQVYNAALSPDQVKVVLNANSTINFGSGQNEATQITGTAETQPVLIWNLNENTGTSALDTSGNNNDGTLTNSPTWTNGKYGTAINFAASNQHVTRADDADLDFAAGGSFTLETWFKHATASAQEVIISKYNEAGYKLLMESDGDITCGIDYDSTWTPTDSVTSTAATYDDGVWHHLTCVKNANTSLTLYIDGLSVGTPDSTLTNSTLENTDPIYYGIDADGTSNDFVGQLDNLVIYNYARTQAQVSYDYNRGGPVVWYKMDECQGTTLYDSGSGGNNATLTIVGSGTFTAAGTCNSAGAADSWYASGVVGKRNSSPGLDGTDDYITTSSVALMAPNATTYSDVSWGGWFFNNTSNAVLMIKDTEFRIVEDASGYPYCTIYTGGSWSTNRFFDTIAQNGAGTWHHLFCTYNGTTLVTYVDGIPSSSSQSGAITSSSSSALILGKNTTSANYLAGKADEVRVYNYALSASQIKKLYNGGASVNFGPASGQP